jgi:hypothetical protein
VNSWHWLLVAELRFTTSRTDSAAGAGEHEVALSKGYNQRGNPRHQRMRISLTGCDKRIRDVHSWAVGGVQPVGGPLVLTVYAVDKLHRSRKNCSAGGYYWQHHVYPPYLLMGTWCGVIGLEVVLGTPRETGIFIGIQRLDLYLI